MAKIFGLLTTAASVFIALLSISLFNFKAMLNNIVVL